MEHIKTGVGAAAADPTALLLFSGGQTRGQAGPRSEGGSYWAVAQQRQWFGEGIWLVKPGVGGGGLRVSDLLTRHVSVGPVSVGRRRAGVEGDGMGWGAIRGLFLSYTDVKQ